MTMGAADLSAQKKKTGLKPRTRPVLLVLLIVCLTLGCVKGWRVYQKGAGLYRDVMRLRELARSPIEDMDFNLLESELIHLRDELDEFAREARPLIWIAPALGWVPVHGGDLANAPVFVELASRLADASLASLQAAEPVLDAVSEPGSALDAASLTALLAGAQPSLLLARDELDRALELRGQIREEALSPRLKELVTQELDPLLGWMDKGLSFASVLPIVGGADGRGSRTYLILVQNEDELRPTGGFITTVGRLVVRDGRIVSLAFEGVDDEEDWSKPFPAAPWQLQEYMNAEVLILRDSNWFADFPTNARWAEYLYSYTHPEPLDGVIAFDQQFLVLLLQAIGPLDVKGVPYAITSGNVIEYMRSAKAPPEGETVSKTWYRKKFIGDLADAILARMADGQKNDWRRLGSVVVQALKERHLLLQFDDPVVTALLAREDWDHAVRPFPGDFLMTTDTNIGFNKTNALMDIRLAYDVDLTNLSTPKAMLMITYRNGSRKNVPCIQFDAGPAPEDYLYAMDRCYWTYTRVYKQSGVELLAASPHEIPAEWMLHGRDVPARVDVLDEELEGVQGFGTLLVVPTGESLDTGFEFSLPATVIARDAGTGLYAYRLKVQKQPGTRAHSLVLRVHLPAHATVQSVNLDALIQGSDVILETDLRTDVYLEVVFHVQ
ncbi:MAG: DUF4012 domain-containing protein [Chloroflexi bacterium]|nr:DUF4012 domain-containing protein [Chloroflexota bacterium]